MQMRTLGLADLLERIGGLLRAERRVVGGSDQLLPVHQDVLNYLARCNRYSNTPATVTDFLQITKGTVSQSILVLERRGLIRKHNDKQDRRQVRLRLTAKGQRLATKHGPNALAVSLTSKLNATELATAERLLTTALRSLQEHNESRSFGQCSTCHHFRDNGQGSFRCGLTGETLKLEETEQICREHEFPASAVL